MIEANLNTLGSANDERLPMTEFGVRCMGTFFNHSLVGATLIRGYMTRFSCRDQLPTLVGDQMSYRIAE